MKWSPVASLAVLVVAAATLCVAQKLNVHVVCHTHDDVGWLKTVDQYYMGSNSSIQFAGVQYILDSVIPALEQNPARKFIYVEIAFFIRWWNEQSSSMQQRVKNLVSNGQLEFINGGWCMNDEAGTHYYDIVDQMTRGHQFLLDTFGVKPTIGWHIDPFGHSAAQAELFSKMAFDGFFFGRIDYQDKNQRLANKQMEMIWRPSPSLGQSAEIFAGVTFNGYGPPDSYCYDIFCQDPQIQNDPNIYDFNLYERADTFVKWVKWSSGSFATNNVMLTMGSDFQYMNANTWFKNLDKLLTFLQTNSTYSDLNIFYSTPSQYLAAVNAAPVTWTVKTDDFFPYSDWEHAMWTGYFTSRVALKGYVRHLSSYLQTCKQLDVMVPSTPSGASPQKLIDAMAVSQHHDAVAGTSKQHVAYDYAKRLSIGAAECGTLIGEAVASLSGSPSSQFSNCPLLNVSICPATTSLQGGQTVAVVLYNNLGSTRTEWVRVPVSVQSITVLNSQQVAVPSSVGASPDPTSAPYTLHFEAEVAPFGFATYFIVANASAPAASTGDDDVDFLQEEIVIVDSDAGVSTSGGGMIENNYVRVTFDGTSGQIVNVLNKVTGVAVNVNQSIMWYKGSEGTPSDGQASGAYIFRPDGDSATPFPLAPVTLTITTGPLLQQAVQQFGTWATQTVRVYVDRDDVEIEYTIGPIDISDNNGKEVITRWTTDWDCANTFYTDSNGREMRERIINYRPTWPLQVFEPVAGNYYPVNSAASLTDKAETSTLFLLNDRSQGGGGVTNGELEVMLHRRLLADDGRGVGEPLNETVNGVGLVVRTKHIMILDNPTRANERHRFGAEHVANPLAVLFAPTASASAWLSSHHANWTALPMALPPQIHLQTVQAWDNDQILLRLEHMFESAESPTYSVPVTLSLSDYFFGAFGVTTATEYTLSANQPVSSVAKPRYTWKTDSTDNLVDLPTPHQPSQANGYTVTINPMEIRTFLLH